MFKNDSFIKSIHENTNPFAKKITTKLYKIRYFKITFCFSYCKNHKSKSQKITITWINFEYSHISEVFFEVETYKQL